MKTRLIFAAVTLFVATATSQARAYEWDTFSKQAEMKDAVIADVGNVATVDPPDGTKWDHDVFRIGSHCFHFVGGHLRYQHDAALLLIDQQNFVKVALIEPSVGSIKADVEMVTLVECPSAISTTIDLLQSIKKQQEQNNAQLKRLQQEQLQYQKLQQQIQK